MSIQCTVEEYLRYHDAKVMLGISGGEKRVCGIRRKLEGLRSLRSRL